MTEHPGQFRIGTTPEGGQFPAGGNTSELNIVEASFPQMCDPLKAGTLDAVAVIEPFRSRITGDQTGNKVADYLADLSPDMNRSPTSPSCSPSRSRVAQRSPTTHANVG